MLYDYIASWPILSICYHYVYVYICTLYGLVLEQPRSVHRMDNLNPIVLLLISDVVLLRYGSPVGTGRLLVMYATSTSIISNVRVVSTAREEHMKGVLKRHHLKRASPAITWQYEQVKTVSFELMSRVERKAAERRNCYGYTKPSYRYSPR
jgi:hypothetical protein